MKFASNKNAKVNPINELDMCVNFGIYSFNYGKQFHIRNANFDSFQGDAQLILQIWIYIKMFALL